MLRSFSQIHKSPFANNLLRPHCRSFYICPLFYGPVFLLCVIAVIFDLVLNGSLKLKCSPLSLHLTKKPDSEYEIGCQTVTTKRSAGATDLSTVNFLYKFKLKILKLNKSVFGQLLVSEHSFLRKHSAYASKKFMLSTEGMQTAFKRDDVIISYMGVF